MKRYFLQMVFMVFITTVLNAAPDSLFVSANKIYSEGNFELAFNTYQEIVDMGVESAELYYNMGNAAFRSNKLGYSVLYYEKALKLDPGFEPAKKNLEHVSLYLEDKIEAVPELFLKRWAKQAVYAFSVKSWGSMSVVFFLVMLLGMLFYIFGRNLWVKKFGFFGGILSLFLFSIALTATLKHHREIIHSAKAVIIAPSVVVRSSPSDSGTEIFVLHEGTRIQTNEIVGEWSEIRIIDGRPGWIPSKSLENI